MGSGLACLGCWRAHILAHARADTSRRSGFGMSGGVNSAALPRTQHILYERAGLDFPLITFDWTRSVGRHLLSRVYNTESK